jgi:hypothetical protein
VVIGILIALQVNNWNENRKLVQREIRILNDIKSDIEKNITNLNAGIERIGESKSNNLKIIYWYEQQTPYSDGMLQAFSSFLDLWDPDFTYAGFENLRNQGVNLVSNEAMRNDIISLFEVEMDILDLSEVSRLNMLNSTMAFPILKKYFNRDRFSALEYWPFVPHSYYKMMHDQEFYAVCVEYAYRQTRSIRRFKAFNQQAEEVISAINSEILKKNR